MAVEVTLAIEPSLSALGESKATVADHLANLGSRFGNRYLSTPRTARKHPWA